MKPHVALLTNIPAPYRLRLWQDLARKMNATVIYTERTEGIRDWQVKFGEDYRYKLLRPYHYWKGHYFNPAILREFFWGGYDAFIIGGYGILTMMLAIILCRIFQRPYLLWSDGEYPKKISFWKQWLKKFFIRDADAYLVSGSNGARFFESYGVPAEKIFNVYLTVDVDYFQEKSKISPERRAELKQKFGLRELVVVCVARLLHDKGIQELIEAFRRLRLKYDHVSLFLVGDGPNRPDYERTIAAEHIPDVVFSGFIQPEELPAYYAISDIFVLLTKFDRWALVINEAMACRLPVITTNMAGAAFDLVRENENGHIVGPNEVDLVTAQLEQLVTDPERLARFRATSTAIISGWTFRESVAGFERAVEYVFRAAGNRSTRG
jgi:glycosyltransferase involved in cell wall biosynthesis